MIAETITQNNKKTNCQRDAASGDMVGSIPANIQKAKTLALAAQQRGDLVLFRKHTHILAAFRRVQ